METFVDSVRIERFLHGLRSHIVLVVAALAVVLPDLVYASDDQRIMMGVSCINAIESAFVSNVTTRAIPSTAQRARSGGAEARRYRSACLVGLRQKVRLITL